MLERLNTKEGRNVGLLLTGCLRRVNGMDTRALATASWRTVDALAEEEVHCCLMRLSFTVQRHRGIPGGVGRLPQYGCADML